MVDPADGGQFDDSPDVLAESWSVAELNDAIQDVLETARDRFPTHVVGEVSDIDRYGFGTFFDLRDVEGEAVIGCLAWSGTLGDVDHELENGMAVVVQAEVEFYPDGGDTQLLIEEFWPLGDSARTEALAELRAELSEAGLLDDARKRPPPEYPDVVGVVTSPSGSAREDFTSAVSDRHPGVTVKLSGATVQGEEAVPSLVGAINRLEHDPAVDVLVVTRGGGADADLWCFNEEPVVRTIAHCATPVIVAIGHEDDETLSAAVADRRAMTPTEAAIVATRNLEAVREQLGQVEIRVRTGYDALVAERLAAYDRRIESAVTAIRQATAARGRIGGLEARIEQGYRTRVDRELDAYETHIASAYRDLEADARIEAGTVEARRLRIVLAVLLAGLVLGAAAVAVLSL
jgi:exodeoxyribonuclease VII large subunit